MCGKVPPPLSHLWAGQFSCIFLPLVTRLQSSAGLWKLPSEQLPFSKFWASAVCCRLNPLRDTHGEKPTEFCGNDQRLPGHVMVWWWARLLSYLVSPDESGSVNVKYVARPETNCPSPPNVPAEEAAQGREVLPLPVMSNGWGVCVCVWLCACVCGCVVVFRWAW